MSEWKKTWCNLCAVTCGLELEVENNKIINVRPDPSSPRSNGYCCRKGRTAKYFVDHGDRVLYPRKKVGDHYECISWEQAYKEIAEKANHILKVHGPRSAAVIGAGTAAVQTAAATAAPMLMAMGSQYIFNPIGVEFMADWWSHGRIFGDQLHFLEADDERSDVMIYWGSNAYVSHQMPNAKRICREFSESPDKMVIVIDPRLSETARMADMHIMPALGSDSLFLRALIALILEKGWENKEYLNRYTKDWTLAKGWFRDFDIDGALRVCKVPREQAEEFARILTTRKWGMHRDLGLFFGRHATMSSYLCIMLTIVCGMCLVPGGNVPPERVIALGGSDERDPKTWRTPVTNRFPVSRVYPEAVIPDEILGSNPDRIRFAITSINNPLRSYPDSQKMEEALRSLELLVAIESCETEVAQFADYVLPSTTAYEGNGGFNIFTLNYPEVVFGCRKQIVTPPGEAKEDSMIFAELTAAMGLIPKLPQWLYKAAEDAVISGDRMKYFMKFGAWLAMGNLKYFDQAPTVMALTLGKAMGSADRAMTWGGMLLSPLPKNAVMAAKVDKKQHPIISRMPILSDLCKMDAAFKLCDDHPEGAVIAHSDEFNLMKRHIKHKDGKLHLWCEEIDKYINRITPEKEEAELTLKGGSNMILSAGRHSDGGVNASMRNSRTFKYRKLYALAMNPEDAKEMGFEDGQTVKLSTNKGSIEIPVECSWQISRGYCMMPHYLGLKFEGKTYGMHVNYLTDHKDIDELTGNARWRYTPCRVETI